MQQSKTVTHRKCEISQHLKRAQSRVEVDGRQDRARMAEEVSRNSAAG